MICKRICVRLSKKNHLFACIIVFWCLFRSLWYQIVVVAFLVRLESWYMSGWMCLNDEILEVVLILCMDCLVCSVGAGAEGWMFLLLSSSAAHTLRGL